MNPFFLGLIGVVLVGSCGVLSAHEYTVARARQVPQNCEDFAAHPIPGWVTLDGCQLDFDGALVGDEEGYERLFDRVDGISRTLHDAPPTWREVLVPLSSATQQGPARVVVAIADPDVLGWLNGLERASDSERARQLKGRMVIQRWRNIARLQAEGVKDHGELQRVVGRAGVPGMILLRRGVVPPAAVPPEAMAFGLAGLGALLWAWIARGRRRGFAAGNENDVSDVKLKLGELEALRRQEGKADDEGYQ